MAFQRLLDNLLKTVGATPEKIDAASASLQFTLPSDYVDILLYTNGAEGFVGGSYLRLYPAERLAELNQSYAVNEFAPGLLIFGSSGGGEAFAFDTRSLPVSIVQIPFIPMNYEYAIHRGTSFNDFLSSLADEQSEDDAGQNTIHPDLIGMEIHEILPTVFGGSPTDPNNKAILLPEVYAEYVVWWNRRFRQLTGKA